MIEIRCIDCTWHIQGDCTHPTLSDASCPYDPNEFHICSCFCSRMYADTSSQEILMTKPEKAKGLQYDQGKLPLQLVPVEAIYAMARAYQNGTKKYAPDNWKLGISYMRQIGSILRHLFSWILGKEKDEESGLHPLDHAICRLSMLVYYETYQEKYKKFDDRKKDT